MTPRQSVALILALVSITLALLAIETASAEPPALAPTVEPTKPPYRFPTPIFIPTYPAEAANVTATPTRLGAATPAASGPGAPTAAPTSKPSGPTTYTVRSGDTPWAIAAKLCGNGAKWQSIMTTNNIADATKIKVGAVLTLPADCGGAALPPAPTSVAQTLPTATPTASAMTLTAAAVVTAVRTSTPASTFPGSLDAAELGLVAINFGSAVLLFGSVLSGTSAWLVYRRARFIDEMTHMARRVRLRDRKPRYLK